MRRTVATVLALSLLAAASPLGAQLAPRPRTPGLTGTAPAARVSLPLPPAGTPQPTGKALSRAIDRRNAAKNNSRFDPTFEKYTKRFFGPGFDWQYFKAQAMAESDLDPNAKSYVGARGLMQLMPSTFREIQTARPEFTSIDDPEWNIAAGIMHDRYLWRYWGGKQVAEDQRFAFMFGAYNAGEGTIGNATKAAQSQKLDHLVWPSIVLVAPTVPRWRYKETLGYVEKIRANHQALPGKP